MRETRAARAAIDGVILCGFLVFAAAAAFLETASAPSFADPMEMGYVDLARHLAAGEGLSTSMLAPYYAPRMPSPISLWPPLYPAAIAAVSRLGLGLPVAARTVSIVAFGLSAALVWRLGTTLFDRPVGAAAATLFAVWPPVTRIAGMALSENLFVLLVLSSVVVTLRLFSQPAPARGAAVSALGGAAMGAAALTRYVGLALIPVGAVALLVGLPRRSFHARLPLAVVWSAAAAVPAVLFLIRNFVVTGALIGSGRPPNEDTLLHHVLFAAKVGALDTLMLLRRILIIPELLGVAPKVLAPVVAGAAAVVLGGALRSDRIRRGLVAAVTVPLASPARRFVASLAAGYWLAMLLARDVMGFMALSTRMLVPAYPLALLLAVAGAAAFVSATDARARRGLAGAAVALCLGAAVGLITPTSLAAGGPRLTPEIPPPWVTWVATHTPPGAPIVGNSGFDYNFYLARPVLSFASYLEYRAGDRFDRDCAMIANHLAILGWDHAYLILHAEDGRLDADLLGRRYGATIAGLLQGAPVLPVRLLVRQREFVVYQIRSLNWRCGQE